MWVHTFLLPLLTTSTVLCLPRDEADVVDYRLPDIYIPINYQLRLNLSETDFTESGTEYSGRVSINFTVTEDTNEIKLHSSYEDLQIYSVMVSGISIDVLDYSVDEVTDILTIFYAVGLVAGQYDILTIDFTGDLTDDMDGFYKSTYQDDLGTTRYLVTTQFETISARRAFPCFDEPAFKATFDISIAYPLGYNAISNTPGTISSSDSTTETIQFETTPKMSTYLLAFVISDFTSDKTESSDGVTHQVWSRDNTNNQRDWGLEMGVKMLDALGNFTGYPYSKFMKKMDQGAIPDFAAGAMENFGLVLYREKALLWDKDEDSNFEKQTVATDIAHEFSHQWFGDLVTLQWWSETFLNEGFATYCEFNIAHEVIPDWQLDGQFIVYVLQGVLVDDSFESEQALVSQASTPDEINGKFSSITYSKGASIIRMLDHVLGRDSFRAGVQNYIAINKFGNAVAEDLWNALNEKVDDSVANLPEELPVVMDNWTVKAGFPLLQVTLSGSELTITQERFLFDSNAREDGTKWYVPITYTTSEDEDKFTKTSPSAWLTPDSDLTITLPSTTAWVIVNNQQTGYYRVNYDEALWTSISEALQKENFDGIVEFSRAQIVNDLFNLARAGKLDYTKLLDYIEFLANDLSYITWMTAFNGFDYLLWVADPELGEAVSNQILRLMSALYESAPASEPNPSDHIYTLKRVLAATWACQLGNQDCVDYSLANFAAYKNQGVKLDTNLKYIICCNGLRYSNDRSDLDFMRSVYENATAAEQWYLAGVLACSPYDDVLDTLEEYLHEMVKEDRRIGSQDVKSAFAVTYKDNPKMVDVVFKYVLNNYKLVAKRFQSSNAPGLALKGVAEKFTTHAQVEQLKAAIESGNLPGEFLTAARHALEIAETNIQWKEEFENDIKKYYGL